MMLNKKGDGHVDWVISIGIFLVYLMGMFVIIKPGIIPVYDYNTLLDIIEEKVKQDVNMVFEQGELKEFGGLYWTLYKVPLFLTGKAEGGNRCIKIKFPYDVDENRLNVYKFELIGGEDVTTALNRNLNDDTLTIENINLDSGNYMIYFSDNKIYSGNGVPSSQNVPLDIECIESADGVNFEYNLGIPEKTRGLGGEDVLLWSKSTDKPVYERIKEIYGYPKSKEFAITITEKNKKYEYKVLEPDIKTNVYTRQWGDFILNYDGTRTPVQVNIRIW